MYQTIYTLIYIRVICISVSLDPSRVLNFQVNAGMRRVVTVPEHSPVYMRCEAEGRPSPHMTIVRNTGDKREVASRPRGAVEFSDQRVVLAYNLTAAPCEASGNYRCEVDNVVGQHTQSVRWYWLTTVGLIAANSVYF